MFHTWSIWAISPGIKMVETLKPWRVSFTDPITLLPEVYYSRWWIQEVGISSKMLIPEDHLKGQIAASITKRIRPKFGRSSCPLNRGLYVVNREPTQLDIYPLSWLSIHSNGSINFHHLLVIPLQHDGGPRGAHRMSQKVSSRNLVGYWSSDECRRHDKMQQQEEGNDLSKGIRKPRSRTQQNIGNFLIWESVTYTPG